MTKQNKPIDYSSLTLPDVIKRVTHKRAPFLELDRYDQWLVLRYISNHRIGIRAFGKKGYDVLRGLFFAFEYHIVSDSERDTEKEEKTFDSFSDFYSYVQGDIYSCTCFFGYSFTEKELDEHRLNIQALNFDSFIDETIDKYSFESVRAINEEDLRPRIERAKIILSLVKRSKRINNIAVLERKCRDLEKALTDQPHLWGSKGLFLSFLLRRDREVIEDAAIKYFCKYGPYSGVDIIDILYYFGKEAALTAADNYNGMYSLSTQKKKAREFRRLANNYLPDVSLQKKDARFDKEKQLYSVSTVFGKYDGLSLVHRDYFGSFEEFAAFLGGDLSGADLSDAPITRKEVEKYKIDGQTRFPVPTVYKNYLVRKYYLKDKFWAVQQWLDEEGDIVLTKKHSFRWLCNYVHFLKGDLSGAELLMCDGLERLPLSANIKFDGALVRSVVAKRLGLPLNSRLTQKHKAICFDETKKNELETVDCFQMTRQEDDGDFQVSYVSDIHLLHRFDAYCCESDADEYYVNCSLAKTIADQATNVNLIAGDITSDYDSYALFIRCLRTYSGLFDHYFITLGNHELWPFADTNIETICQTYKQIVNDPGSQRLHLVHNNLFYFADEGWIEIDSNTLASISVEDLKSITRSSKLIIFGGIGFAGENLSFNANFGIYRKALSRAQEIEESKRFFRLYEKVTEALAGRNLIVLTHMPMKDWGGDAAAKPGVVYVSGHSHRNFFFDNGIKRIYADNQIGYTGRIVSLKRLSINFDYNWFEDYKDGIYEINRYDYESFYRGINESLSFNRRFEKLFLVKRESTYMFFMQAEGGKLYILNGGAIKSAGKHPLEYYYAHLKEYSASIKLFLSSFDEFQKQVSREIKKIGGYGTIHGSIVDIDFENHLYLNPLDGSITPYFAYSMTDKYVYDNIPSLLSNKCPKIYKKFVEVTSSNQGSEHSLVLYACNLPITKHRVFVESTEMYRISRILKGLQFTTKYNIVRLWNDAIVADVSEATGRLIVSGIIDPSSIVQPKVIEGPKQERTPRLPKPHPKALSKKEKADTRSKQYIDFVHAQTNGHIICLVYRGSTEKADYQCCACGHEWSTRPDHFKDRQGFQCPKCKKAASE